VLPLQFMEGTSAQTLRLNGTEIFDLVGIEPDIKPRSPVTLVVARADGATEEIPLVVRIDTPVETDYYTQGGVLPFVLRNLLARETNV
jgi:aconitate hydratase A / 2-methylisocitrate dehydratase